MARQRLSKKEGRDASPQGSHFCGEAAPIPPETALLSDPEVYEPEGRLKFGSAPASGS